MYRYLSKAPLALAHGDSLYPELIRHLNAAIDDYVPEPFGFKTASNFSQSENFRFIVPLARLFRAEPIATLLRRWVSDHLPVFLWHLRKTVFDSSFEFKQPEHLQMYLRFRVLQDRNGYSLTPHKDSADTLFAFLLQLSEGNPTTSLFYKNPKSHKVTHPLLPVTDVKKLKLVVDAFLSDIYSSETRFELTGSQFNSSEFWAWDEHNCVWSLRPPVQDDGELIVIQHSEHQLRVPFGNLLAIHNPLKDYAFSSERSKFFQVHGTHGFFPCKFDIRNLLICDFLCTHVTAKGSQLKPPPTSNPDHEYHLFLKPETSVKILKQSGFF